MQNGHEKPQTTLEKYLGLMKKNHQIAEDIRFEFCYGSKTQMQILITRMKVIKMQIEELKNSHDVKEYLENRNKEKDKRYKKKKEENKPFNNFNKLKHVKVYPHRRTRHFNQKAN